MATANLTYRPRFFEEQKAYAHYCPDVVGAYIEGVEYARTKGLRTAGQLMEQGISHAIFAADLEDDFRDDGRLPVAGTNDVCLRMAVRFINGTTMDYYSSFFYSQDGHPPQHISYGVYWRDHKGMPLDLRTRKAACLTLVDENRAVFKAYGFNPDGSTVDLGYYQPRFDATGPNGAVAYWKHLQATGQGDIWVFDTHCVLGTDGVNLHPLVAEAVAFFAGARSAQPVILFKGHISTKDWFGPLRPCMDDTTHPLGGFQKDVVDAFKLHKTTELWGVAEDFCDYHMKRQVIEYYEEDTATARENLGRLRFVTDGTVPIIRNAAHVAAQNEKARKAGVKFITADTPFGDS